MFTRKRKRLTSAQREELWDSEVAKTLASGRGQFPICNICGNGIFPGQEWHVSHNKHLPHAIGGDVDGISHARCNLDHNHAIDTPLVAKVKRQRQKHIGAFQRSVFNRLPCGRDSQWRKKLTGEVVPR
jgi:hypothetical protein